MKRSFSAAALLVSLALSSAILAGCIPTGASVGDEPRRTVTSTGDAKDFTRVSGQAVEVTMKDPKDLQALERVSANEDDVAAALVPTWDSEQRPGRMVFLVGDVGDGLAAESAAKALEKVSGVERAEVTSPSVVTVEFPLGRKVRGLTREGGRVLVAPQLDRRIRAQVGETGTYVVFDDDGRYTLLASLDSRARSRDVEPFVDAIAAATRVNIDASRVVYAPGDR